MRRKMNKGVSMVEILISIAIFTILMVPIVSSVISSMNNTTDAKTLQYRNEFAENMMEYVKQDSLENVLKGDYLEEFGSYSLDTKADFYDKAGAYDSNLEKFVDVVDAYDTHDSNVIHTHTLTNQQTAFPYEQYKVSGKVNLGTKHETYSYVMEISNKYYAEKQAETNEKPKADRYVNPNNLALGVVEDIDHTKVALINGTIANYDATVADAFLTKKIDLLYEHYEEQYKQYVQNTEDPLLFPNDTARRLITIKVTGSETKGYVVTCSLRYKEKSVWNNSALNQYLSDYYIEYTPFEYKYPADSSNGNKAMLPNIYLMYNVCLYNGWYSPDDYIAIDTSGVTDDTPVNVFIVETAETYSKDVLDANTDLVKKDENDIVVTDILYNNEVSSGSTSRSGVKVHLAATTGSKLSNLSVYHNFDIKTNTDSNKKNGVILYQSSDTGWFSGMNDNNAYIPLKNYAAGAQSVADFGTLDEAQQESRGLYQIKIWMDEVDDPSQVDTSKSPIMTGTKGGDES